MFTSEITNFSEGNSAQGFIEIDPKSPIRIDIGHDLEIFPNAIKIAAILVGFWVRISVEASSYDLLSSTSPECILTAICLLQPT